MTCRRLGIAGVVDHDVERARRRATTLGRLAGRPGRRGATVAVARQRGDERLEAVGPAGGERRRAPRARPAPGRWRRRCPTTLRSSRTRAPSSSARRRSVPDVGVRYFRRPWTRRRASARTLARYCQRCDDGDFDALGELFERDATFTVMGQDHFGRDSIRASSRRRSRRSCGASTSSASPTSRSTTRRVAASSPTTCSYEGAARSRRPAGTTTRCAAPRRRVALHRARSVPRDPILKLTLRPARARIARLRSTSTRRVAAAAELLVEGVVVDRPAAARGSASTNSTDRGFLYDAIFARQCSMSSLGGGRLAVLEHDDRLHRLAPRRVGHADDRPPPSPPGATAARPRPRPDRCSRPPT